MAEIASVAGVAAPIVPSGGGKALASAPKTEVSVSNLPKTITNNPPPRPGSAKDTMFKTLRKQVGVEPAEPAAPAVAEKKEVPKIDNEDGSGTAEAPAEVEEAPEGEVEEVAPVAEGEEKTAAAPAKAPADAEKKKVSPWKLVEEWKAKAAAAEAKVVETEKRAIPEAKWKEQESKFTEIQKRNEELESEIKFVNYSKSKEFNEKYKEPYVQSWSRAMGELGDLTVQENGNTRPISANDVLELVNLPLQKAHELAVEKFGELAPEVMAHRKEIRKLSDEQNSALERAKKEGGEREKANTDKQAREFGEVSDVVKKTWSQANDNIRADKKYGTYFTPRDGDEQGNQRLSKGYELADRAFSENPLAPGLTSEQRQSIVERHAAVRNRCAAFGRLVYDNQQKDAKLVALQKIVDEYKGSEPARGGSEPERKDQPQGNRREQMFTELRRRAKQPV